MAVVRKASNRRVVKRTSTTDTATIRTTRDPHSIEELGDTNFGTLDESKDGMVVSYDAKTDKFILITADDVFIESASDDDIPDEFIDQVEAEVDLGSIAIGDLDGGSFV